MADNAKNTILRPLELTERSVLTLFKKCLATDSNSSQGIYFSQVLREENCGKKSEIVKLSKEMVDSYTPSIQYLLGQIKSFHTERESFSLQEGFLRYDDTFWTKDYDVLFKLYSLGLSSASITSFVSLKNLIISAKSPECMPTLSPKDPNYQEWFGGYEAKVKKKTLRGQEPADD